MTVLLTRSEMQTIDRLAIDELGIPSLVLMEVAGRACAARAEALAREERGAVLALAGLGNNGGDAVVVARLLADRGLDVVLVVVGDPSRGSAELKAELAIASRLGVAPVIVASDAELPVLEAALASSRVVVDGLFGTGLSRAVEGLFARVIDVVNTSGKKIVAVDIPSGIDADTGQILGAAIRADHTVTFQHAKLGHFVHPGRAHTGALEVADIGIPRAFVARVAPQAELVEPSIVHAALPPRHAEAHKGTFGHLLVVAGVPDRPGAALLAARAALRTGSGLVTIGSDAETIRRVAPVLDELMGLTVGVSVIEAERVIEALATRTALAIGPSLPATPETARLLRDVLSATDVPAVVDAGALAALGADVAWLRDRRAPTVLTPHPGEAARLAGTDVREIQRDRLRSARDLADRTGAVVILKGASSLVASPGGRIGVVDRGNPGMATGGMGDVLTGIVGSLLGQGLTAELAARCGAFVHGAAGDRAAVRGEARLVASDLLAELGGPR
ncbi:NAD(P)H-hydrate dehydratase [Myxococcota bacterium]|nr:NAD(P)H-hydrate dehydratase [Myxococcota bacterium]